MWLERVVASTRVMAVAEVMAAIVPRLVLLPSVVVAAAGLAKLQRPADRVAAPARGGLLTVEPAARALWARATTVVHGPLPGLEVAQEVVVPAGMGMITPPLPLGRTAVLVNRATSQA